MIRGGAADRYDTFLSLSGDAIGRFELRPPLDAAAREDEQVAHILAHARVTECNDLFARFYGRSVGDMVGLVLGDFVPADDPARLHGIREFVRSRFRLVYGEEEHPLAAGHSRWVGASALGALEDGRLHGFWVCLREITERKRAELDRERRDRILEAVAFSATRLLQPGSWRVQAEEVLARLGQAAQVARVYLGEKEDQPDGSPRIVFRAAWGAPGVVTLLDDPRIQGGWALVEGGLGRIADEMRACRAVVTLVKDLPPHERLLPERMGSRAFAVVPIFANGHWWGILGFGETRYEREWSASEVEALKAAAPVIGAAIERERADEALRESEERFRRLSAASFEGIAITEGGVFVDGNEQLGVLLGLPTTALVDRPVEEFVAPEDRELVRSHIASGSEEPYPHRALRRDGSSFPVEVRARSLPYRGRSVRVTALRDITARVEAEERQRHLEGDLRNAAEQWRQTFDALDLGIVIADAEGRIVRLNRRALALATPSSFPDAVGRKLERLLPPEPWRSALDLHLRVGESGTSLTAEARDASTGRSFSLLASPWVREAQAPPWRIITFRDVTEFTTIQEQLRRARLMEAMGSLVAGVAHEVRNPLFSISAAVDALEPQIGERTGFAEYAALLRSQVNRLSQLMRHLLDYGKPSMLRPSPTSLAEVWRRAGRACAALARERRVTVTERVAADLPLLHLDGAQMEQALKNLLANAIQHAPAGSAVLVLAGLDGSGPVPLVRSTVEDEGSGLSPENLERIFEPFFSSRKGGTGLGLPIVQRVVDAHGGRVLAENRDEGGARFTVLLPVHPAPQGHDRG